MPVVKSYRRYIPAEQGCLGVISSGTSTAFINDKQVACATLSTVTIYEVRTGTIVRVLGDAFDTNAVTSLVVSPDAETVAVGHEDGTIRLWSISTGEELVTFSGHRSAVNALLFIEDALQLVSGANDTDLIVWDIVNEAGIVRLHGHSGPITDIAYLEEQKLLLTTSRDHLVKVWDAEAQHCVQTIVGHRSEVQSIALAENGARVITGSNDNELRVWAVLARDVATEEQVKASQAAEGVSVVFLPIGSLKRQSRERTVSIKLSADGTLISCQNADKTIELFRFRTEDQIAKKIKRRTKRMREKHGAQDNELDISEDFTQRTLDDEIYATGIIRTTAKIRSHGLAVSKASDGKIRAAIALNNNMLETYDIEPSAPGKIANHSKITDISFTGHRTPIRAVALSHDDAQILTTANKRAKVWDVKKRQCIRTLESDYGLCAAFVPGNRHAIIGTRSGSLQLFELSSGRIIEEHTNAHDGAIWTLDLQPDKHGFVTGGADNAVHFWEYELVTDETSAIQSKRLSCAHVKTLKMTDSVMCVKYSPDQRFLAIALLDCTVKVFYADTLKFFLSLYGHKLPVVTMDISRDSTLLVTGSGDKNVKLWGMDFGDCHKSFFAHQDVITGVRFIGISHYFFSVSKDKTIKLWDGDKFEYILTLKGHHAEISSLTVSQNGSLMVTASHDKSVRIWDRSNELINLEEERENEREQEQDQEAADDEAAYARARARTEEADLPSKQNVETLKAADRIVEAIELVEIEMSKESGDAPNAILMAYKLTAEEYLLREISRVPSSELEGALLVLPFTYAMKLIPYFDEWIRSGQSVERCSRCLFFLVKVHHNQITSQEMLLPTLQSLRENALPQISSLKDTIGFNLAALKFLQQEVTEAGVRNFDDVKEIASGAKEITKKRKLIK